MDSNQQLPVHLTPNGQFVQIVNIAGEAGHINMYLTPCTLAETPKLLKQQIAALYSTDDKLTTTRPKIKNSGYGECGLFAIANGTTTCVVDPTSQDWDQLVMWRHLGRCFEAGHMEMIPTATAGKPHVIGMVETTG